MNPEMHIRLYTHSILSLVPGPGIIPIIFGTCMDFHEIFDTTLILRLPDLRISSLNLGPLFRSKYNLGKERGML